MSAVLPEMFLNKKRRQFRTLYLSVQRIILDRTQRFFTLLGASNFMKMVCHAVGRRGLAFYSVTQFSAFRALT